MTLSGYDAAYPPEHPPATDVVEIYAGGDTPHAWTDAEIAAQAATYGLPVWVRYPMPGPGAGIDAAGMLRWLRAHEVPTGCYVMLDVETGVDPSYVSAFGDRLHSAGYKVAVYGSRSTAYQNPPLDGYIIAHWDGNPALDEGSSAIGDQYASFPTYDLDTFKAGLDFWRLRPAAPAPDPSPAPAPSTKEEVPMFIAHAISRSSTPHPGTDTYIDPGYECLVSGPGEVAHLAVVPDSDALSSHYPLVSLSGDTVLALIIGDWL